MSDKPIRNHVAMTGEVSLRGRVIPVAGLREKVSAAHRVGIRFVILPKGNEKNLLDVPKRIKEETKFIFVERVEEVFKIALLDYAENQKNGEEILIKEIGKTVKATKKRGLKKVAKETLKNKK
jgi:ATP-dependent Lon protease